MQMFYKQIWLHWTYCSVISTKACAAGDPLPEAFFQLASSSL
jgi:hypothetical protein